MTKSIFACLTGLAVGANAAIISSGSGTYTIGSPSTSYTTGAAQAGVIGEWLSGVNANAEISLSGSMTLSEVSSWTDRLWFVVSSSGDFVPTNPDNISAVGLAARVSVSDNPNAPLEIKEDGANAVSTTLGVSDADRVVDYALNLTLDSNFATSLPQTHVYELGLDIDNDGTYDYIRSGTFDTTAGSNNRIRFGFGVVQAGRTEATQLSNDWTYTLQDQHVNIPEPGTLGLIGAFGGAILFIRRRMAI